MLGDQYFLSGIFWFWTILVYVLWPTSFLEFYGSFLSALFSHLYLFCLFVCFSSFWGVIIIIIIIIIVIIIIINLKTGIQKMLIGED